MSHFTVTVLVTAKRLAANGLTGLRIVPSAIEVLVAKMLEPYNEQTKDKQYLKFVDEEDEMRAEFATGARSMVRTPDGDLLEPWNERFRVRGIGIGSDTHRVPDDCQRVEIPFKEFYADFHAFAEDYHGHDGPDEETGRYGHWRNPQGYWDWWQIGGRWTGFYPVASTSLVALGSNIHDDRSAPWAMERAAAAGRSDIVRVRNLDMDTIARETRERAEAFWVDWQAWLAGTFKGKDPFDTPRGRAMSIGLLTVVQGPAGESDHARKVIPWAGEVRDDDSRKDWNDVARLIDRDTFMADYIDCFNPIATYAAVDNDGWHAPGKMGWFGCSSDEPDAKVKFQKEFVKRFVRGAQPDDVLVVVDCHV